MLKHDSYCIMFASSTSSHLRRSKNNSCWQKRESMSIRNWKMC